MFINLIHFISSNISTLAIFVSAVATLTIAVLAVATFRQNKVTQEKIDRLSAASFLSDLILKSKLKSDAIYQGFANYATLVGYPEEFYRMIPELHLQRLLGEDYYKFLICMDPRDTVFLEYSWKEVKKLAKKLYVEQVFTLTDMNLKKASDKLISGIVSQEIKNELPELLGQVDKIRLQQSKEYISKIVNQVENLVDLITELKSKKIDADQMFFHSNNQLKRNYEELRVSIYGHQEHFHEKS